MKFNPSITEILREFKINKDQGLLFLLGIYYELDVDTICPEEVVKSMALTKIVEKDYEKNTIQWNIPLFDGQETNWNWVVEWNNRWKANPERKASNPDVLKRMKNFFATYPEYRKEDVIKATDAYFARTTAQYLKNSAAFIFDGAGAMKKSILAGWCANTVANNGNTNSNQKGKVVS